RRLSGEKRTFAEQLEEDEPDAVEIAPRIDVAAAQHLGRHVARGSDDDARLRCAVAEVARQIRARRRAREPEADELRHVEACGRRLIETRAPRQTRAASCGEPKPGGTSFTATSTSVSRSIARNTVAKPPDPKACPSS